MSVNINNIGNGLLCHCKTHNVCQSYALLTLYMKIGVSAYALHTYAFALSADRGADSCYLQIPYALNLECLCIKLKLFEALVQFIGTSTYIS